MAYPVYRPIRYIPNDCGYGCGGYGDYGGSGPSCKKIQRKALKFAKKVAKAKPGSSKQKRKQQLYDYWAGLLASQCSEFLPSDAAAGAAELEAQGVTPEGDSIMEDGLTMGTVLPIAAFGLGLAVLGTVAVVVIKKKKRSY